MKVIIVIFLGVLPMIFCVVFREIIVEIFGSYLTSLTVKFSNHFINLSDPHLINLKWKM